MRGDEVKTFHWMIFHDFELHSRRLDSGGTDQSLMTRHRQDDSSDAALIQRICEADHDAFEALYQRYYQRLFRFSYRVTHRLDQVEEIINDVMYVVWKKAHTFNHQARASTWILGIAYKKCLKTIAERLSAEHLTLDDVEELLPAIEDSGLKNLEIEDWLAVALSRLPPDQRAVLELTYHHGLHYREIAEIMGCPENTVKTRMFHARKKIKSLIPDLVDEPKSDDRGKSI
ncbi:MAG TPA: sigma-70 family RNA polymerase sigma factor [Methylococcaceae bacterium]|nr:sigma-70 family RNA polymerase sigma factor [Methylococcaceae bacterium]